MLGRIVYAVLVGLAVFIVLSIVGSLFHIALVVAYAGVIGFLVALYLFFTRNSGTPVA